MSSSSIANSGSVFRQSPTSTNHPLIPTPNDGSSRTGAATPEQLAMSKVALREARADWFTALERPYLAALLRVHGDNVSRIARVAGVDRKTMRRLLRKYGLRAASEPAATQPAFELAR